MRCGALERWEKGNIADVVLTRLLFELPIADSYAAAVRTAGQVLRRAWERLPPDQLPVVRIAQ